MTVEASRLLEGMLNVIGAELSATTSQQGVERYATLHTCISMLGKVGLLAVREHKRGGLTTEELAEAYITIQSLNSSYQG